MCQFDGSLIVEAYTLYSSTLNVVSAPPQIVRVQSLHAGANMKMSTSLRVCVPVNEAQQISLTLYYVATCIRVFICFPCLFVACSKYPCSSCSFTSVFVSIVVWQCYLAVCRGIINFTSLCLVFVSHATNRAYVSCRWIPSVSACLTDLISNLFVSIQYMYFTYSCLQPIP